MGVVPRVQRIGAIDVLTGAQRELLAQATPRDVAELVVYWLDDGSALVAPRNPAVEVGTDIVCVGSAQALQRVAVSEGRVVEEVDLHVVAEVQPWSPWRR